MKQLSVIGLSQAGKTCYLYAMAKTMLSGLDGITVNAIEHEQSLMLQRGWQRISQSRLWPEGTDRVTLCEFNCSMNLKTIMEFVWNDFRGGALDSINEIDEDFRREFIEYLSHSDGLIFFLPADVIHDILSNTEDARVLDDELDTLINLFLANSQVLAKIPITIAVTKADILTEKQKGIVYQYIESRFPVLFEEGNNIKVLVIPVSIGRIGRANGTHIVGTVYSNPMDGNIHIPIVFNLYHFLNESVASEKQSLKALEENEKKLNQDLDAANAMSSVTRWFLGINRDNIIAQIMSNRDKTRETSEKIEQLKNVINKVVNLFPEDCQYYVNGSIARLIK